MKMLRYQSCKALFSISLLWRGNTVGLEHIPASGACILASNHESYFDFFLLVAIIKRPIRYLAGEKFFSHPIWKIIMYLGDCIKIDRISGIDIRSYKLITTAVKNEELIGIFPEGTRSPDGKLLRGKTGVARLALKLGIPVIPIGVNSTHKILPKGKLMPRFCKADIIIGEPLKFNISSHLNHSERDLQRVSDEIMLAIAKLAKKEYVFEV